MSLETTIATAYVNAVEKLLREHYGMCSTCGRAKRERTPGNMCTDGLVLRNDLATASAKAKAERQADKAPSPDQLKMF